MKELLKQLSEIEESISEIDFEFKIISDTNNAYYKKFGTELERFSELKEISFRKKEKLQEKYDLICKIQKETSKEIKKLSGKNLIAA